MKRLIGLLLALCLIIGLLPVVASADEVKFDDSAKIRLLGQVDLVAEKDGAAKYIRTTENGEAKICSAEDDWNIKFEYVDGWAVLTLNGARLGKSLGNGEYALPYMKEVHAIEAPRNSPFYRLKVIVQEDSIFDTGFGGIICQGSKDDVYMSDIWIESVNNAKLDIFCANGYRALQAADYDTYEGTLTINANLNITQVINYKYATSLTASHVVIKGGNITLNNANACIDAQKSLTIEGGNITMNCSNGTVISPIQMPNGEVTINGGTVKMHKTEDGGGVVNCKKLTINGGAVFGEGYTYAVNASEVAFNGGVIELKARSEDGDARVFMDGAPDLAKYNNPAAVIGSSRYDVAKYEPDLAAEMGTGYFMLATAGTPEAPNLPADQPEPPATKPPVTEPPATEPPATEPPATEPPATEPPATSEIPTESKAPNNADKNGNGTRGISDWILWIVAAILLLATGVVVFILIKRKKEDSDSQENTQVVEGVGGELEEITEEETEEVIEEIIEEDPAE